MTILTWHNKEIEELGSRLEGLVKRAYRELTRETAEEIANNLIEEKGLDDICRDIDEAIEEVEDQIDYEADRLSTYTFDNYLLATFAPYPESTEVDEDIIKELVCDKDFTVDKVIGTFAYELWRIGIRKELEEILKKKCEEKGLLKSVLARIRR